MRTLNTIQTKTSKTGDRYEYTFTIVENGLETDKAVTIRTTGPIYMNGKLWLELDIPE